MLLLFIYLIFLKQLEAITHANPLFGGHSKLPDLSKVNKSDLILSSQQKEAILLKHINPGGALNLGHVFNNEEVSG